jgi:hypothetical protein
LEDGAGLAAGQSDALYLECFQRGGEVLAQQRAELVGQLLAVPDRVLLGAGQYRDRLD